MADNYSDLIESAGRQYNVDPALLRSVIGVESGGNPNAVSEVGAVGLGQLMPDTAKRLGVTDARDPKQNIFGAARLLDELITKANGDVNLALTRYHGGYDESRWGPRTAAYAGKVFNKLGQGQNMAQTMAGIPDFSSEPDFAETGQTTDDIFDSYLKGAGSPGGTVKTQQETTSGSTEDDIFNQFVKAPQTSTPPAAATTVSPSEAGQDYGFMPGAVGNFIDAAGHNAGNAVLGLAQTGLHGLDAVTGLNSAGGLDNFIQQREQRYQQAVPDNAASYAGAAVGQVAPFLAAGGTQLLTKGAQLGSRVASAIGQGGRALPAIGTAGGSATLGGLTALASPVLGNDYGAEKAQQVGAGATIGALLPGVTNAAARTGAYLGNAVGSVVRPFTERGQQRIAENAVRGAAGDAPVAVNATELVPGSLPTLAEATGNPGIAGLQRALASRAGGNELAQRQTQNAAARAEAVERLRGTPQDIDRLTAARDLAAGRSLRGVFDNPSPANPQPVVDAIDGILSGSSGKRDAVQSVLNNIRGKLVNADGTLETDAATLYNSVRKQIGDMLDAKMSVADPKGIQASRELLQVRDVLDNAIEDAAPGFAAFRSAYSDASRPINALEALQGLKLENAQGNVTLSQVQNAIANISKAKRSPVTAKNTARSVTDDQLTALRALRDDLLRESKGLNSGQNAIRGSTTAQNLDNLASLEAASGLAPGRLGQMLASSGNFGGAGVGGLLGLAAAGPVGAGVGAGVGGAVSNVLGSAIKGQNEAIQQRVLDLLLNPKKAEALLSSPPRGRTPTTVNPNVNVAGTTGLLGLINNGRTSK